MVFYVPLQKFLEGRDELLSLCFMYVFLICKQEAGARSHGDQKHRLLGQTELGSNPTFTLYAIGTLGNLLNSFAF